MIFSPDLSNFLGPVARRPLGLYGARRWTFHRLTSSRQVATPCVLAQVTCTKLYEDLIRASLVALLDVAGRRLRGQ